MRAAAPATTTILVLALAVVSGAPAAARTYQVGEVEGTANRALIYGLLARVEHWDADLVAIANGGRAGSPNWDDGDLNYGKRGRRE